MKINQLELIIKENWKYWFEKPLPDRFYFLKTSGNSLSKGRVIILVFEDSSTDPILVVKIPRNQEQYNAIQAEYNTLKQLQDFSVLGIPRPLLFLEQTKGIYFETPIIGKLMGNIRSPWISNLQYLTRELIKKHFQQAFKWLEMLGERTLVEPKEFNEDCLMKIIQKSILGEVEYEALSSNLKEIVESFLPLVIKDLEGTRLPLVCEHGDFWAGNIFLRARDVGVIDWTGASFQRLPLYDAPFFVVSYTLGFYVKRGNHFIFFEELLKDEGFIAHLAIPMLQRYFQTVGITHINPWHSIGIAVLRRAILEKTQNTGITVYQTMLDMWARRFLNAG